MEGESVSFLNAGPGYVVAHDYVLMQYMGQRAGVPVEGVCAVPLSLSPSLFSHQRP
jgi:hypothetical protein